MGEETRLIIFRKLTPKDAEAAAELDLKCFGAKDACSREYFYNVTQDRRFEFLVAERGGKIISCAGAEIYSGTAEIESLAVDPDNRCCGVGTLILVELIEAVKSRGVSFIVLEVRPSNAAAIALYQNFGFQIVERAKKYYLDEDAWIMAKEIS